MKRIFTLFFLAFSFVQISKADAEFFLKIKQQGNYKVWLNQEMYETKKNNIVRFFDLIPGNYNLKVVRQMGWMQQIVFQENIQLQNGFRYAAELQPQYGLKMLAQIPFVQNEWYIDQLITNNYPNQYPPNYYPNNYPNQPHQQPDWNHQHNSNNNGWNNYYGMDENSFKQLKSTVNNSVFDVDKIQVAKSVLAKNYITSAQAKELLSLINFESNRLTLAKFCYDKTLDQQNYFTVYDTFTFSSSVNELSDYISKQR